MRIHYAVYEKEPAHGSKENAVILAPFDTMEEARDAGIKYGYSGDNYYVDRIIQRGDIMYTDGYPILKDGELVKVQIDGFIEDLSSPTARALVKCSFYDEYATNHICTHDELFWNK